MARWEGDAAGRLRDAAMRLYVERGYEQTTVADIASEAGLTARTFFRHFADKREVLFAGSERLRAAMVAGLDSVPPEAGPMAAVEAALDASTAFLGRDHEHSRRRMSVIYANPELLERELIKMATLAAAMADGLRRRGVPPADATLAAETGTVVLRVAFEQWLSGPPNTDLRNQMQQTLHRLAAVTTRAEFTRAQPSR